VEESGGLWSAFYGGFVMSNHQTFLSPNLSIFKPYAPYMPYTMNIMVCQALKSPEKIIKNLKNHRISGKKIQIS